MGYEYEQEWVFVLAKLKDPIEPMLAGRVGWDPGPGLCGMDDGASARRYKFIPNIQVRGSVDAEAGGDGLVGSPSVLRTVWSAFSASQIRKERRERRNQERGHGSVSSEKVLLEDMRPGLQALPSSVQRRIQKESEKIQEAVLRDVRDGGGSPDTSYKSKMVGELRDEFDDFMYYLSHESTLEERFPGARAEVLRGLWRGCYEAGVLRETLQTLPEAWRSLSSEEKSWIILRVDGGSSRHAAWPGVVQKIPLGVTVSDWEKRIKVMVTMVQPEFIVDAWEILRRM